MAPQNKAGQLRPKKHLPHGFEANIFFNIFKIIIILLIGKNEYE